MDLELLNVLLMMEPLPETELEQEQNLNPILCLFSTFKDDKCSLAKRN